MKPYPLNQAQGAIETLPALEATPGYSNIKGSPTASIRFDQGQPDSKHRLGVWMCTPGSFSCIEKGDELQTLLEGSLTLILEDGSEHQFGPGDSFFTEKGERVTWQINETVKKVYFTHDVDGH